MKLYLFLYFLLCILFLFSGRMRTNSLSASTELTIWSLATCLKWTLSVIQCAICPLAPPLLKKICLTKQNQMPAKDQTFFRPRNECLALTSNTTLTNFISSFPQGTELTVCVLLLLVRSINRWFESGVGFFKTSSI
jgi:hypothetical protein